MSAAAVLAIVVAVGEAQSPASTALLDAARESLGTAASIRLVETDNLTDARAIRFEHDLGAGVVAVLTWKEPAHLHAVVRVHVARADRWTTRFVTFDSGDTLFERGRTLGFAVASMTPEKPDAPTPPVRPSPVPVPVPVPPPSFPPLSPPSPLPPTARRTSSPTPRVAEQTAAGSPSPPSVTVLPEASAPPPSAAVPPAPLSSPRDLVARASAEGQESAAQKAPVDEGHAEGPDDKASDAEVAAAPRRSRRFAIGIAAVGSLGLGEPQRALGGKVTIAWYPTPTLAIRGDVGLRVASLPELPGSDRLGSLGLGLEWWPVIDRTKQGWGVGVRADALLTGLQVTGTVLDGHSEAHYRFLPGADFVLQAFAALTRSWELLVGAALEGVPGATDIRRGDDHVVVATIPAIRAVGELGLRLRF